MPFSDRAPGRVRLPGRPLHLLMESRYGRSHRQQNNTIKVAEHPNLTLSAF